ncbi:MAG TPA: hypothetical protein VL624_03250, partial [Caldimonas sp.]|nr:hypothetical protein [Caldimonas sp.]
MSRFEDRSTLGASIAAGVLPLRRLEPRTRLHVDSVSPVLVDRLLAISRALAGHVDPGQAFRATAVE